MTAIVCVDKNWAIGRDNALLFHISADLKLSLIHISEPTRRS